MNGTQNIYFLLEALLPFDEQIKAGEEIPSTEATHLTELTSLIHNMYPADIAELLEALPAEERSLLWHLTNPKEDGEILLEVSDPIREALIEDMDKQELTAVTDHLEADDLAELYDDLPRDVREEALEKLDTDERIQVNKAMRYSEDSVGALMDFTEENLITVRADMKCEEVLEHLRTYRHSERGELPRKFDKIFVIDSEERLCGTFSLRHLLVSALSDLVMEKMLPLDDVIYFHPEDDAERAAQAFAKYDLVSAPVVDEQMRLLGRITVDDMMDVFREETEEDMRRIIGVGDEDLFAPLLESLKKRGMWILVNLVTAIGASRIVASFENIISQLVALAALLPIIAGIAGNSGNQTITMIVRAMGSGQLTTWLQIRHLFGKELLLGFVNGILWGGIIGLITFFFYKDFNLSVVMMSALILNLLLAAFMGVGIPLFWRRIGLDPAMGSSVAITACTDCGGFLILLALAKYFLL